MPMRAVVFDFDGVLVDSEPLHFRALRDTLDAEGLTIGEEEYRSRYLARADREALRFALAHHGRPATAADVERLASRLGERFFELIPEIALFPGVAELVGSLRTQVPLAIASGARRDQIEDILRRNGLQDGFATIVAAEDASPAKPDPAPYLETVRRLSARVPALEARQCLALEDSVPGITSARAAGLKVVGVAHTYAAVDLRSAHHVVGSLAGLDGAGLLALAET